LREGERSDNIYVVVDSSKIARCSWCGTTESENWIGSDFGIYCSTGCSLAANTPVSILMFTFFALMWLPSIAFLPVSSGSVLFLVLALLSLCCSLPGLIQRRSVPNGSRANGVPLDTALLATVSTSVICPRCDANLDLRNIGEDRVYVCGYCGATGTIEIINKGGQK